MKIRIREGASSQFGENGPKPGDTGTCIYVLRADDDLYAVCVMDAFRTLFNIPFGDILHANTEDTKTFWTTL